MMKRFFIILLVLVFAFSSTFAQTTEFTYQGRLINGSLPANGNFDFEFTLYDAEINGMALGTIPQNNVTVTNGTFSVRLDFGANFPGDNRFLEIKVRQTGDPTFTQLNPRQKITSSPYSYRSNNAGTANLADVANNSLQLNGVAANQFVLTNDSRLSDARMPLSGSPDYIQNTLSSQTGVNFTIGGTGSANNFNAFTQYNIGGSRVLGIAGTANTFVGLNAGNANDSTLGTNNSFFGNSAGLSNTTGIQNSFFGNTTGNSNTTGSFNSFFGRRAGFGNTTGSNNTFVGLTAGFSNSSGNNNTAIGAGADLTINNLSFATAVGAGATVGTSNTIALGRSNGNDTVLIPGNLNVTGNISGNINSSGTISANIFNAATQYNIGGNRVFSVSLSSGNTFAGQNSGINTIGIFNSYFGYGAGSQTTTGANNSFFGYASGFNNTSGFSNSFFGINAGRENTTGDRNTFIGDFAGATNTTGSRNTIIGTDADVTVNNLTYATAIGAGATVNTSNTVVLGRFLDSVQVPGNLNVTGNNTANIFSATTQYNIGNSRVLSAPTFDSIVVGAGAGDSLTATGSSNSFFGNSAGNNTTSGKFNTFVGNGSGFSNTIGANNSFFGRNAGNTNTTGSNNTLIGTNADVASNNLTFSTAIGANSSVSMSNTIALGRSDGSDTVVIYGLGSAGNTSLCRNALNQISTCSSSIRYKSNINDFRPGLSLVKRLRPVSFNWQADNSPDMGLVAEEVAEVEPLLVIRNKNGEVEGVKYDRVGVVLVNAVQEQQIQIEAQQKQIDEQQEVIKKQEERLEKQQKQIDALKALVCSENPTAELCKVTEEQK